MTPDLNQLAARLGFTAITRFSPGQLVFRFDYRAYCEKNDCGRYGTNYGCPPACGTPQQIKDRLLGYTDALAVQTLCPIAPIGQRSLLRQAQLEHNARLRRLMEELPAPYHGGLLITAGGCTSCERCTLPDGLPCRSPALQSVSLSACCVDVQALAKTLGWVYDAGPDKVAFFGLYLFGKTDPDSIKTDG